LWSRQGELRLGAIKLEKALPLPENNFPSLLGEGVSGVRRKPYYAALFSQKVYELYGLTEKEMQVIEASLVSKSKSPFNKASFELPCANVIMSGR